MEVIRTHKSLLGVFVLGTLMLAVTPTRVTASATPGANNGSLITKRGVAVLVPFTAVLFMCSENGRTLASKAYYKSAITTLKLMKHCPFSDSMQQTITNKLEQMEAQYITRSGNSITSENLRNFIKEFKELVDATKNALEVYKWIHPATK